MDRDHPSETADVPPDRPDPVDEADEESFPASDPPARTSAIGIPDRPLERPDR